MGKINHEKLERILLELGIGCRRKGAQHLRVAVELWAERPGQRLVTELYPAVAARTGTTPRAAERAMRCSLIDAWGHADWYGKTAYFGSTRPPMLGEFIAVLAMLCSEEGGR